MQTKTKTVLDGAYVLTASQILLNGRAIDASQKPTVGQEFCWVGDPVRLDGPQSVMVLGGVEARNALQTRAARIAKRRFDFTVAEATPNSDDTATTDSFDEQSVVVSDGTFEYSLVPIVPPNGTETLYLCSDGLPLGEATLKVIRVPQEAKVKRLVSDFGGDVICFTQGTAIRTADGVVRVEQLSVGDKVQTKDNGLQEVLWIGKRRMSGARLHAIPDLRPIRLRRDALGSDIPDEELLVSPQHRVLITGEHAQALFNQPEVLVRAQDLLNDHSVFVDHAVREVTYIHLLFAEHQIIWANGVQSESYHPANTTLKTVDASQRGSLLELFPDLKRDPYSYGGFARRNLTRSEAAILMGV